MSSKTQLRRQSLTLLAVVCSATLAACGADSANTSTTSPQDRETARLRLQKCLRDNGVNIRERSAAGPGGGAAQGAIARVDDTKMRAAMQACEKYRKDAFGNITAQQRQEFRDAFTKFSACMRRQGVDMPAPGAPGSGPLRTRLRITPKMQAAMKACQSNLPQRGQSGRGGGPVLVGPGQ